MSNIYYATPYDISATGFYFKNLEEYCSKAATHKNAYGDPVEEFEIQFIDGDNHHLFRALGINQATLALWFEAFEDLNDDQAVAAIYLAEYVGVSIKDITDQIDDVHLFEGSLLEYAEDYVESTGLLSEVPESLRYYFDMEAFARDLRIGGDVTEYELGSRQWIVQL